MDYSVVIPAAGSGQRMGLGYNKVLFRFQGKSVLEHTVHCFTQDHRCKQIIVIHAQGEENDMKAALQAIMNDERDKAINKGNLTTIQFVVGGKQRSDSVYAGLKEVKERIVLIHDGARPFVSNERIDALLESLREYQASILAVPCKDTIKVVTNNVIVSTPSRDTLWQAQTPQAFHIELIKHSYEQAQKMGVVLTDDASAVELCSDQEVHIVMGSYDNIKITTQEDLKGLE